MWPGFSICMRFIAGLRRTRIGRGVRLIGFCIVLQCFLSLFSCRFFIICMLMLRLWEAERATLNLQVEVEVQTISAYVPLSVCFFLLLSPPHQIIFVDSRTPGYNISVKKCAGHVSLMLKPCTYGICTCCKNLLRYGYITLRC